MRRTLFGAPLVTLLVMLQGTPAPLGLSAAHAALPGAVATKVEPRLLRDFDEAPDDTKSRLTKANTFQNKGRVFATGLADGKSVKGDFKLSMGEIAAGAAKANDEAVTRQRVPREYEQFAKEYFQGLEKAAK